ncbi:hypothetical protein AVEN_60507-1 [Araneus ventricosus]|uniref:Uncharacterized protein n=1 Tax=Araneus ventricosus TaxID=182803 RepID=A0A4Y2G951_ARAVE|nr:hypothetical protein AVEN_60507-1 [Araneus ventricosus]
MEPEFFGLLSFTFHEKFLTVDTLDYPNADVKCIYWPSLGLNLYDYHLWRILKNVMYPQISTMFAELDDICHECETTPKGLLQNVSLFTSLSLRHPIFGGVVSISRLSVMRFLVRIL